MPNDLPPESTKKPAPAGQTVDRRSAERFPFSAVAEITEISSKCKVDVRIADIGRRGCYADSVNVFPVGTGVQLKIRHAETVLEIGAIVIYSVAGMGMGLNFARIPREMDATLMRWLSEAGGETAPTLDSALASDWDPAPSVEREVLTSLIKLMMRKGLLSDSESRNLLDEIANRWRSGEGL